MGIQSPCQLSKQPDPQAAAIAACENYCEALSPSALVVLGSLDIQANESS